MREIKFRAFHKEEKKMCEVATINFSDGFAYLLGVKPGEDQFIGDREVVVAPKDGRACSFAEIEIMQFTGLLDKNGEPIFEGDILGSRIPEIDVKGEIEWHTNTASWQLIAYDSNRVAMTHFRFWGGPSYYELTNSNLFEIIGNIYDNPELLK